MSINYSRKKSIRERESNSISNLIEMGFMLNSYPFWFDMWRVVNLWMFFFRLDWRSTRSISIQTSQPQPTRWTMGKLKKIQSLQIKQPQNSKREQKTEQSDYVEFNLTFLKFFPKIYLSGDDVPLSLMMLALNFHQNFPTIFIPCALCCCCCWWRGLMNIKSLTTLGFIVSSLSSVFNPQLAYNFLLNRYFAWLHM